MKYIIMCLCLSSIVCAKLEQDLHYNFWANYNGYGNNQTAAFTWYKKFLCKQNQPGYKYKGLLHLFAQTNNSQSIISLMPIVEKSFANDPEMQLIFVQSLQQSGQQDAADERVIKLLYKTPDNQELAFHAAQVYLRKKEPENALETIDNYLNHCPGRLNNFVFYFLKAQIYMLLQENDKALAQLKQSLDIHPSFDKGWLMYGLLQEQTGRMKKAIKGYTNFLEVSDAPIPYVQEHLLRIAFREKMLEAQQKQLKLDPTGFEKALLLFKEKKYRKALEQIDQCLEKEPRDTDSKIVKVQIMNAMDQAGKALEYVCSWIKQDPERSLWLELGHLLATQADLETQLVAHLRAIQADTPDDLHLALYLADLYARTEQADASISQHKRAYQLTRDVTMKARILTHLAAVYYDYDHPESLKHLVHQAEALPHDFAPLHNTVAYYFATRGKDLDRAQLRVAKALKQDPTNPFYMNTQAVIYYKQKNYTVAQKLFEQSAQALPEEPRVLKHLAKCYIKQERPTLALSPLKKACEHAQNAQRKQLQSLIRSINTSLT